MPNLKHTIEELAANFATTLIQALKSLSLEELLAETSGQAARRGTGRPPKGASLTVSQPSNGGRLARRSAADIGKTVEAIVALLRKHPKGLRSEQIQQATGLAKREIVGPLGAALTAKKITKKGQRRATTYFAR